MLLATPESGDRGDRYDLLAIADISKKIAA